MGFEKLVEEAAGAFAADKALEAVDPNAGFLAKAAAAVGGFEGVDALTDHFAAKTEDSETDQVEADPSVAESTDAEDANS